MKVNIQTDLLQLASRWPASTVVRRLREWGEQSRGAHRRRLLSLADYLAAWGYPS